MGNRRSGSRRPAAAGTCVVTEELGSDPQEVAVAVREPSSPAGTDRAAPPYSATRTAIAGRIRAARRAGHTVAMIDAAIAAPTVKPISVQAIG